MEFFISIAGKICIPIFGKIVEYSIEPVGHHLGYLCFLDNNIQNLKIEVEMLNQTKEIVHHMVNLAIRNVEEIRSDVKDWLKKVDEKIAESEGIIQASEGQQIGLCVNFVQRYQSNRKVAKMAEELLELKIKGNSYGVSNPVAFSSSSSVGSSSKNMSDFFNFESRKLTMKQIIDALLDDNVSMIGVHGMGGVGKTMLIKEISRKVMDSQSFDEVVTSTVSQTLNLKNIQLQLAEKLRLKFEQETVEGRALKLHKRLKMGKRILIVFDDIWEYIDLETIGIPCAADHKGCKVLFTSRSKDVLSNDMCIDKTFEIKVLEEVEAWNLFKKMTNETVEASDLKPTAIEIVKECALLPIAITTVANVLKSKSSSIWKDALNQLRNPVVGNIRGMDKKVYSSLKLSYDYLECQEAKLLFLLCSMFPEDFVINVEDLHVYAMGINLLQGVVTVADGRHRIEKLVDDLISSSLLLQYEDNYVKMHDIIRDVAILIASKDEQIRTLSYVKRFSEWEEEKTTGDHIIVYLDVDGLCSPTQKLMLPKVQLLMIQASFSDKLKVSESFFEEMKELKVLELRDMKFLRLPQSPYSFLNIKSLHLICCELGNIDMIGELIKLEFLSFKASNIIQIPTSMSQLTQLKVLDISYCYELKVIPPNILLKLTKLEELYLEHFNGWEAEELNKGRKNVGISELKYLSRLSTLTLHIKDEKIMPKQLFSRELNLEKFKITIGTTHTMSMSHSRNFRMLCLEMELGSCMDDWIKMLLKKAEELELTGSIVARVLLFELDGNNSSHVKHLDLSNNSDLHFICEFEKPSLKSLSNLEHLRMFNLENLKSIIHRNVREPLFNKLRVIKVYECNKLGSLFFSPILDQLFNLEKIHISTCKAVEVIILMENGEATKKIELTRLNSLQLVELPQLRNFCSKIQKLGESSLENSKTTGARTFSNDVSFFSEKVSLPNLEKLIIRKANNLKMIWHNVLIPNAFSKLKEVEIDSCNNLEKAFPSNIMSVLTCLQSLQVKNCDLLERVFEVQEPTNSVVLLPNLRRLKLFNLPNLEYLWSNNLWELQVFENIEDLTIHQCPKVKGMYLSVKVIRQLEYLMIDFFRLKNIVEKEKSVQMLDMDTIKTSKVETIQLQDGPKLFSKLKTLKLYGTLDYNNLNHLPMEIVQILDNLKEFEMKGTFIGEIFTNERLINIEEHQIAGCWPLERLKLHELPKLRHLWKEVSERNASSLQNLDKLCMRRCGIFNNLVPSSMSFRNLTDLSVQECHRLTHLFNPSVARTLVQLSFLTVGNCKRMDTVIAGGAEEENDEIIFNNLHVLRLGYFSKLTSFCSGKCIIRCPYLDHIFIGKCPEMKVFSLGTVSTPRLRIKNIGLYYNNERFLTKDLREIIVEDINVIVRQAWDNSYDTNIKYLFMEQNLEEGQRDHILLHMLRN